jgi:hypothetical protein
MSLLNQINNVNSENLKKLKPKNLNQKDESSYWAKSYIICGFKIVFATTKTIKVSKRWPPINFKIAFDIAMHFLFSQKEFLKLELFF